MTAKNLSERKKRLLTFAGLYVASLVLLFFILSAFGVRFDGGGGGQTQLPIRTGEIIAAAGTELAQTDSTLHAGLRALQQSDDNLRMLPDTASSLRHTEALMQVNNNEAALKNAIDSIEILSAASTNGSMMNKVMVNSFRKILDDRAKFKNLQATIASGKTTLSGGQQDMLQWKDQLLQKDNEISRLETQLKAMQQAVTGVGKGSGAGEALQGEIELLKTAFAGEQKAKEQVKDELRRVKSENSALAARITDMKNTPPVPVSNTSSASEKRVAQLEQELENMNADLNFARIDCNLTRADAQQIISNARQRKELLIESLGMLNSLAKSGDDGIQKKAKEKIVRLNRIATTLHD